MESGGEAVHAERRASGGCVSVLVVDDDAAGRELLAEWLRGRGYAVEEAEDGERALQLLAQGPCVDVIVLDLAMPGMDGWTFLARLRADPRLAPCRVLVLTAEPVRNAPAEADAFVCKPFVPERFAVVLSRVAANAR
ncbi:response regulator [Anaeromyxobacter paludicola]|uniref:Two-component system response regulator n=1 Tax=Anaeromyxobacter paludicola TaxID=2918171 RepID=A0ABM7XDS9_9BACT|nr:response regulator [Anaeromyxobacter paludicola]BDG10029.1 two-component system response regulator [Anaeromyxobacter paludicola]